jgi:dihydroorotase
MSELGVPLCVHGEETAPEVDVFDRERVFLERTLAPLLECYDGLRVVFEHITTLEAARFVESARPGVAASVTPQHLLMNRNDLFVGGLQPHHYCLPVLKRSTHQAELLRVATGGSPRFFLGTDSAPHARGRKESSCGCAGCFSAPAALELYATAFEAEGALAALPGFAAHHAADFYGLPREQRTQLLRRESWTVPERLPYLPGEEIIPYWAGRELAWRSA